MEPEASGIEAALDAWLAPFLDVLGRKTQRRWAPTHLHGLLGPDGRKSLQPMAARLGHMTPEVVAKWMEHTPLDRVGQPADIAAAALFLASEEASWITGTTLVVDGGLMNTAYPKVGETFAE